MSRETERDLAAMVKVEKRAKETARAERDDLRRQLAVAIERIQRIEQGSQELRCELAEAQAELDQIRQERDRARRALHLRDLEDTGLYDAYGQSLK